MRIVGAVRQRLTARHGTDFYGAAERIRSVPAGELAVAEAALTGGGPIADRFARQLSEARGAYRLIGEDGSFELRIVANGDLLVRGVARAGWTSDPIHVRATPSGRELELRLVSSVAGIVELHGTTRDGERWPTNWTATPEDLVSIRARAPLFRLPTPTDLREAHAQAIGVIESWLAEPGILRGKRGVASADPPAAPEQVTAFEEAQGFALPQAYRDLLLVANGIEIGSTIVLGTDDAYRLDIPGPDRLVIAPPDEEGAFVLAPGGEIRFVDHADGTSEGRIRAPDLRAWVSRRVAGRRRPPGVHSR
jgi:hypothetical protein